jgi:hypothetical protein
MNAIKTPFILNHAHLVSKAHKQFIDNKDYISLCSRFEERCAMEERKRVCEAWNNEENDDDLEVQESSPSQNLLLLGSRPQQQVMYST